MNIVGSVKSALSKTFIFKGRASRLEFWSYTLLWFPFLFCAAFLIGFFKGGMLGVGDEELDQTIILLVGISVLPFFSLQARRLHDIGKSGWWQLLAWFPIVFFLSLYWYCKKGDEGKNSFGENPLSTSKDANF